MSAAIKVENLSKLYHIGGTEHDSIRDAIMGAFRRSPDRREATVLWALKDISFEVQQGETLGIIGRNGAGKSTLLKILSRITRPTSGSAEIYGRVGSLLEVGTGFHNELSGRENIFLNGAILGMKRTEIAKKFDEIVEFSEVEKFLDTPVKHYSSGMYMRLAFAVAAHLEPEVLIVDEVLAVGDINFQRKCLGKMGEVSRSGRTVLFVSHNVGSLGQICNKGLLLENGRTKMIGPIEQAIDQYLAATETERRFKLDEPDENRAIEISEVFITNGNGIEATEIAYDESLAVEFKMTIRQRRRGALLCVALLNKNKERVFTEHKLVDDLVREGSSSAHLKFGIPKNFVAPNHYSFLVQIFMPDGEIIHNLFGICPFNVVDTGSDLSAYSDYGVVQANGRWQVAE
jgi:lipopolysaccharide transport system ATP-binding protein